VRILLRQLEIPCERIAVDIFDGDTLTDEYARLHPQRATPVLQTDEGRVLIESNAILWYLAAGTPLLPADPAGQAEVCRWLIYEQTDVMPGIGGLRFRLITGRVAPDSEAAAERRRIGVGVLRLLDSHLQGRSFLVGDAYSIADVAVFAYAHLAEETGYAVGEHPSFTGWLERVAAQPGFVNDLVPYPPNASVQAGRSVYG
jgi:glutathione S-transferase